MDGNVPHSSYEECSSKHSKKNSLGIPRIIMQTWKDNNLPEHWKESPKSIKKHLPDWKYVFLIDSDLEKYVKDKHPEYLDLYNKFEYTIQRIDFFRILWLYDNGGVYMDLDFEILRPLDGLFESNSELYVVQSGNVGHVITNSFIAARKGSPILKEYLDAMYDKYPWWAYGRHLKVMSSTGPLCFSKILKNTDRTYTILPKKYMMPCSVCDVVCQPDEGCYLKATKGCSWVAWDSHMYNYFNCNWKSVIFSILIIVIVILIYLLLKWWYKW